MSQPYLLFQLSNLMILPFWAALLMAPKSGFTRKLLAGPWICAALAILYGFLVVPAASELLPLLAKPELDQIRELLGSPLGAAAGWIHFLTFDLFVGRWIWMDALKSQRSIWALRVVLLLTLMFGPLGLLAYLFWTTGPWRRMFSNRGALWTLTAFCPLFLVVSLIGLALDPRIITALPVWMKPLKFALSTLIYCLTLEALLTRLKSSVWAQRVRTVSGVCLAVELLIIFVQAARGTTSHFNFNTPLDSVLFALMGLCIVPIWLCVLVVTILLYQDQDLEASFRLALTWGAGIAFVGLGWGWAMISLGSHTVGAPDGGPGLPILGWSTVAGDLRVAHFLGFHGLQMLPLLWFLTPSRKAVHGHGLMLLWLVNWQGVLALQGHTAFRYEPVTLVCLAVWALGIWWSRK